MAKKPFSAIFDKYKTYDPAKAGYGSVSEWGRQFDERMGYEEAAKVMDENRSDPLSILGLTSLPGTIDALKKIYRAMVLKHQEAFRAHADKTMQEVAKRIIAAYSVLLTRIERRDAK